MEIVIGINSISYYQYLRQNKFRKYITKEGRKYKEIVEDIFKDVMKDKLISDWECRVSVCFNFDTKHKHDIDNYIKPLLDFMSEIVFTDDKLVVCLIIQKEYNSDNYPFIHIKVDTEIDKNCLICEEIKKIDKFVKKKNICKKCKYIYDKKYRLDNKDKVYVYNQIYHSKHS